MITFLLSLLDILHGQKPVFFIPSSSVCKSTINIILYDQTKIGDDPIVSHSYTCITAGVSQVRLENAVTLAPKLNLQHRCLYVPTKHLYLLGICESVASAFSAMVY